MFTTGLIVGIFIGLVITSRHFRVNIANNLKKFYLWIKFAFERKKKIEELEQEIQRLKGNGFTIKHLD